jgi:hypothetical protein
LAALGLVALVSLISAACRGSSAMALGSARVRLAAGAAGTATVRLTSKAQRLVRQRKIVNIRVTTGVIGSSTFRTVWRSLSRGRA